MARFPVIVGDTIYGEPAAYDLRTGEPKLRQNPLAGADTPWNFSRSYGCGSISAGPNLLLFRSGTLGMYALAGDTGIHHFGAVRAGCHVNAIAANGLVLMPPADAGCTCSYCYQTTVALAPAQKQENWSIFFERLPKASVRQAATSSRTMAPMSTSCICHSRRPASRSAMNSTFSTSPLSRSTSPTKMSRF